MSTTTLIKLTAPSLQAEGFATRSMTRVKVYINRSYLPCNIELVVRRKRTIYNRYSNCTALPARAHSEYICRHPYLFHSLISDSDIDFTVDIDFVF